jgi:F-type H+-transporting ATPase subunit a
MPHHTSFFHYVVAWLFAQFPALEANFANLRHVIAGDKVGGAHAAEPLVASLFICLLIVGFALLVRPRLTNLDGAVIPEESLTLRTVMEGLVAIFYGMMVDMMGPKQAKRYFPIIGTSACFVFFGNMIGLVPGINPPTSTWSITLGCALVVFVMFNYYGIKENGVGYFKHLMGPVPLLAPLIFCIEVFSISIRPLTLSIRLMLNMAVDHLLVSIFFLLVPIFVPVPVLMLSTLICIVQTVVFCLLSSIYIALAIEHVEGHGEEHDAHALKKAAGPDTDTTDTDDEPAAPAHA